MAVLSSITSLAIGALALRVFLVNDNYSSLQ